jgi:hypothetical protein
LSGLWPSILGRSHRFEISGGKFTIVAEEWAGRPSYVYLTGTVEGRDFQGSHPGGPDPDGGIRFPSRFKGSLLEDNNSLRMTHTLAPELAETPEVQQAAQRAAQQGYLTWTHNWRR